MIKEDFLISEIKAQFKYTIENTNDKNYVNNKSKVIKEELKDSYISVISLKIKLMMNQD